MNTAAPSRKKLLSLVLTLVFMLTCLPAALAVDLNVDAGFYFKQSRGGTCTLASAAMMLRRRAYLDGLTDWTAVTENSVRSTAWANGLSHSFTYKEMQVGYGTLPSRKQEKIQTLITLLSQHPEGIVLYDRSQPHALLLTDYTNGTFYCSDPAGNISSGRIPLENSSVSINGSSCYWYVASDHNAVASSPDSLRLEGMSYPINIHAGKGMALTGTANAALGTTLTNVQVAVLDETGKLKAYTTIYPTEPKNDIKGTEAVLKKIVEKYHTDIIVIGNGTASRETEEVVANFIKKEGYDIQYTIVNEAGASVYSASKLAAEEYPDLDVTTRGAMSLGRRLQDPLAELVKIDPKSIGVGQYQHDINQKLLEGALTNVVEDCVNRVGVDLNTASPSLLSYIAGVNMGIAKNIVAYREEHGRFNNRKELLKVPKLGEKAFNQCAGFMRITEGENPLDATSVHPESYGAAQAMMEKLGVDPQAVRAGGDKDMEKKIKAAYPAKSLNQSIAAMAADLGVGEMTLTDIIEEMKKPARDPREDAPPVIFRNDVKSFEDLKIDMEMTGTVRNVVDFGAFVDIGVKNDGLVHISQLSDKYIKHPMDVVSVGDTVKVKIISIDYDKKKVGLTMKGLKGNN